MKWTLFFKRLTILKYKQIKPYLICKTIPHMYYYTFYIYVILTGGPLEPGRPGRPCRDRQIISGQKIYLCCKKYQTVILYHFIIIICLLWLTLVPSSPVGPGSPVGPLRPGSPCRHKLNINVMSPYIDSGEMLSPVVWSIRSTNWLILTYFTLDSFWYVLNK